MKRKRLDSSSNPIFERCLEELAENGTTEKEKLRFEEALCSLRKCPLRFESPIDCILLSNFDVGLCQKLNDKVKSLGDRSTCNKNSNGLPIIRVDCRSKEDIKEVQEDNEKIVPITLPYDTFYDNGKFRAPENKLPRKSVRNNSLFETFLKKLHEKAKNIKNHEKEETFSDAIKAVQNCSFDLESGLDCKLLLGFSNLLCDMLDRLLKDHVPINGKEGKKKDVIASTGLSRSKTDSDLNVKKKQKKLTEKKVPDNSLRKGSSIYAILLALYEESNKIGYRGFMSSKDLEMQARKYASFPETELKHNSSYWLYMNPLIKQGLIIKTSAKQPLYNITTEGRLTIKRMQNDKPTTIEVSSGEEEEKEEISQVFNRTRSMNEVYKRVLESPYKDSHQSTEMQNVDAVDDVFMHEFDKSWDSDSSETTETSRKNPASSESSKMTKTVFFVPDEDDPNFVRLRPCTFDIILLIDVQETNGKFKAQDMETELAQLSENNVMFEVRHLNVGDFVWIARCRETGGELVLPHIVERKRMDDFSHSIQDGRFHEQKFRLKQSGLKNVIYLVENGKKLHVSMPMSSLYQAAINSLVNDDFTLKYTNSLKETIFYLGVYTKQLVRQYRRKTLEYCKKKTLLSGCSHSEDVLPCMNFTEFNQSSNKTKNFKVREMFVRQLVRLNGVSIEKALAIAELYPTPKLLSQGFLFSGQDLLAKVTYGVAKKNVGPVVSKTLHQFYTLRVLK